MGGDCSFFWFGIGNFSVIFTCFILPLSFGASFVAVMNLSPTLSEVCKAYHFGFFKRLKVLYLPTTLPFLLSNLSIVFAMGIKIMIMAELLGASGCGKSTLLRCIVGILKPESGVIKNEKSAFVFQERSLFENLNAFENIALTMPKPDKKWILEQFRLFLLDEKDMLKNPSQLNDGMCARVAFIRALAYNSPLFLLDEPFSGLDFYIKILVQKLIEKVKIEQASALLVTHDAFEVFVKR